MNVLFSSTMYPRSHQGWQGVFIGHIANALARRPDIGLRICAPPGEYPEASSTTTTESERRWLGQMVDRGGISHLLRRRRPSALLAPARLLWILGRNYRAGNPPDVYHVNWMQSAIPLPDNGVPALITVLGNDMKLLGLPGMRLLMRRVLANRRTVLAPNADWMEAPLRQAFGDIATVRAVPFGIDPMWYAIQRTAFQQPRPRWLVVSRLTRPKIGALFEWGEALFASGQRELHLFGPMEEQIELPTWVHYHGPTAPSELSARHFPSATGLITLSHHAEGRPQVMLEAMASGLPIIASRMPAHEDIVADGATGVLCNDFATFEQAIVRLEDRDTNTGMSQAARARVMDAFGTWDDCASRYVSLYHDLRDTTP